jgi:ribosomal-protein-alanine N-acetyltransferase
MAAPKGALRPPQRDRARHEAARMNAVVKPDRVLHELSESDLDAVMAIERAVYEFPWTRGNFIDSLRAGYLMRALTLPSQGLVGYFIALAGVNELHLLNLSVAPAWQHHGHGRHMLDHLRQLAGERHAVQLWLEVRHSNGAARELYERYGFRTLGLRRGYYPAPGRQREDAVVMSLQIERGDRAAR